MINWFIIGNMTTFIGTILLIRTLFKNRRTLKGYNIIGSLLTSFAMVCFIIAFYTINDLISIGLTMVTFLYWIFVTIFLFKNKINKKNEVKVIK